MGLLGDAGEADSSCSPADGGRAPASPSGSKDRQLSRSGQLGLVAILPLPSAATGPGSEKELC